MEAILKLKLWSFLIVKLYFINFQKRIFLTTLSNAQFIRLYTRIRNFSFIRPKQINTFPFLCHAQYIERKNVNRKDISQSFTFLTHLHSNDKFTGERRAPEAASLACCRAIQIMWREEKNSLTPLTKTCHVNLSHN